MTDSVYLVTGSMGCIGAWTLYHLVRRGERVVSFDLSGRRDRINLLLSAEEQQAIDFVTGDLTNTESVLKTVQDRGITHIVHLAALQVPFARANPVLGAQVNVVGTINIFEAAKQQGITKIAYASSIAVYGPPDRYPPGLIAHDAPPDPHTLYGVYKQADEGAARVYWWDYQLPSTALRPYIVYGVGRDQGMTSEPTKAMLAAAAGQPFHMTFGGVGQYQLASDVAQQFIECADTSADGAFVFNLGGKPTSMQDVVTAIRSVRPDAQVTFDDRQLPFPMGFDDSALRAHSASVHETPLEDGIRQTIEHFERCLADQRIAYPAQS